MNSHQRRVFARRKHMLLPLGKEVHIKIYGIESMLEKTTVFRHRNGGMGTGSPYRVDIRMQYKDGTVRVHDFRVTLVHLKNPADRAPRPWWSQMARDAR
jgi:hypothetical protein